MLFTLRDVLMVILIVGVALGIYVWRHRAARRHLDRAEDREWKGLPPEE